MSYVKNEGNYTYGELGSVLTYSKDDSYGTVYGQRVLKEIFVPGHGYRVVTEGVKILKGEVVKYGGENLAVWTPTTLKQEYPYLHVADPKVTPVKGDILLGKHKGSGTEMAFVYVTDTQVERLNTRPDLKSLGRNGYTTLSDVEENYGPLTIHTIQGYALEKNGKKFSEL